MSADGGYNDYRLTGRTVIVTGAGSGIGRAVAQGFASQGCNVVLAGRSSAPLQETALLIHPERALIVPTDVRDGDEVERLVAAALTRFGSIDVVVSNAATYASGLIEDVDADSYLSMMATNVDGSVFLVQEALPHLGQGSSILFTTSVSGLRGDWNQALYNATKGALTTLMQSLALDLGERGIRVNAVAPSFTPLGAVAERLVEDPTLRSLHEDRVALGRVGLPDDAVPAFLFLASDDARYITGITVPVDGGTSASTGQAHMRVPRSGLR